MRQIDQIKRRVIDGEVIAHAEKVFSIFETHTEWICKGKAGVPMELGLKTCILEDQYQFILHQKVMEKQSDDQVAQEMVIDAKKRYPKLNACSFDKGFHSPENQAVQGAIGTGGLAQERQAEQTGPERRTGTRVCQGTPGTLCRESAINALEVHGLDICNEGIEGFKRYVALAVVARNIHRIGAIVGNKT